MPDDRNQYQIIRKDARNCFVESLNDAFGIGRVHFAFATYDLSRPAGSRQTNNIHIYITVEEFLELCRKLNSGELRYMLQSKKKLEKAPACISIWAAPLPKSSPGRGGAGQTKRVFPGQFSSCLAASRTSFSLQIAVPGKPMPKV